MLLEQTTLAGDTYLAQAESCGYVDNSALLLSCPHIHSSYVYGSILGDTGLEEWEDRTSLGSIIF